MPGKLTALKQLKAACLQQMFPQNSETLPNVRFAGFTVAWEQRRLGELIEISSASRVHKDEWTNEGVPFFRSSDVTSIFKGTQNTKAYISHGLYESLSAKSGRVKKHDVLATGGGSIAIPYLVPNDEPLYFKDADLIWMKTSEKVRGQFLYNFFTSPNLRNYVQTISHVGTISHYTIEQAKDTPISLPTANEQDKIGQFFRTLDNTIAIYKRKLDELHELKKAYLQQMFPQDGESVPRLRFAGFTEPWTKQKLGDIADIVRGASPRPIQDPIWFDDSSDVGWLRISDVTQQNGRIHHLEQKLSKAGQAKTRVLNEPHLLLSIAATVGKPVVNYIKTGVHDGFLIFLNPQFEQEFLFQWLEMFRLKWQQYGQPGSQVNLNSDLVKAQELYLPSIEEQTAIGNFFINLDNQIALHQ